MVPSACTACGSLSKAFLAAIFNDTPVDYEFELEGFYLECPEAVEDVERTGKLI
jgi:hypothetical protein